MIDININDPKNNPINPVSEKVGNKNYEDGYHNSFFLEANQVFWGP